MPSVEGRRKLAVAAAFVAAGAASGALVGFIIALPFLPIPEPGLMVVAGLIAAAVVLDLVATTGIGPPPPTSGRQVPQEWSRYFGPGTVAVLYGLRLGVGPLTILSTWTWWAVTLASALLGPGAAVLVGGTFGLVRLLVTVLVSTLAGRANDPAEHIAWFGRLRKGERPNRLALNGAGLFLVAAVVLTGCGAAERRAAVPIDVKPSDVAAEALAAELANAAGHNNPAVVSGQDRTRTEQEITEPLETTDRAQPEHAPPTIPVRLEDVVRTTTIPPNSNPESSDEQAEPGEREPPVVAALADESPEALATALPTALVGFTAIDDPSADRFLDLAAASAIQPDPTEEVALLETRGFAGGWTRAFRSETNDVAVASVYHFEDATEAEFYLEDGLITIGGYGGKFFDIPALPGVRGFVQYFTEPGEPGAPDEELISLGAAFQLGPRWHLLYLVGSVETVTPDVLIPAVTALSETAQQV